jgi:hypothetical protein
MQDGCVLASHFILWARSASYRSLDQWKPSARLGCRGTRANLKAQLRPPGTGGLECGVGAKRPMLLKLIEALRSEKQRQQYWTNFRGTTLVVNPYDQKQHCDGYGSSDRANYGGLGHS